MAGSEADSDWSFSFTDNSLWKLKERLKYTGWLQYCIGFFWAVPPLLLSSVEHWIMGSAVYMPGLAVGLLGLATFELATCKYNIRPTEALPVSPNPKIQTDIAAIKARYACRSYQSRNLTPEHRQEIMTVAQTHIQNKLFAEHKIRFEYMAQPLVVWPAVNCKEFMVAIAPKSYYSKHAIMDVGRALEKTVIHATKLGIASCIIGPGADHKSTIETLGPQKFDVEQDHIICVCALGYQSTYAPSFIRLISKAMRNRLPPAQLFFKDAKCTIPITEPELTQEPYAIFQQALECARWSPSSYNAQTTRGVLAIEEKSIDDKKLVIQQFDVYRANKSKYYATVAVGIWMANWELACQQLGLAGTWMVDPSREQENASTTEPPLYDISWVLDKPIPVTTTQASATATALGETSPLIAKNK